MGKEMLQEKKYFSITEVSELCEVKSHTLRFWEKEFKHLKPVTRKGNRRYYQKEDIRLIKKIRALLYEDGMTITGAKRSLQSSTQEDSQDTEMKTLLKDLEDLLIKIK